MITDWRVQSQTNTGILSCRVGLELKAKFILFAEERGMKVNHLLTTIVEETMDQTNELRIEKMTLDHEKLQKEFSQLHEDLKKVRTDNLVQLRNAEFTFQEEFKNLEKESDDSFWNKIPGGALKKVKKLSPLNLHAATNPQ